MAVLHIIAAACTIAVGLYSLIWPHGIRGFTGLAAEGGRGVTEIRAVMGGFFVGLGVFSMVLGGAAYRLLGWTYLVVAAVRCASMFVDRSMVRSNVISFASEVLLGLMLIF